MTEPTLRSAPEPPSAHPVTEHWCTFCQQSGHTASQHLAPTSVDRELELARRDIAELRERLIEANRGWSDTLDKVEREGLGDVGKSEPMYALVRSEGFELVVDDGAPDRPDILGAPQRDELCAQACKGNVIAIRSGLALQDAFYAVSHEIAEVRHDFSGHHQAVFREQCAIMGRWCRKLYRANMAAALRLVALGRS